MNMTHYMELLATNQPWNLIIFMAIPVVLGGCPKFCVNGQLAGNCHIDRRHHEQQETRCT